MSVTLAPKTEDQIRRWIDSGHYPDADAVVLDALHLLEERNQASYLRLRELVRAGFESGDEVDLTPELWDELVREAEEEDRLGLPIRAEVTLLGSLDHLYHGHSPQRCHFQRSLS